MDKIKLPVNWWTVLWYIFFGWTEREPKAKVLANSSEDCNNKALHNRLIMSTNSADVDDPNEVLQNIHRTRSFSTVVDLYVDPSTHHNYNKFCQI